MEEKKDIFDRLMHLPVLNIFEPFYKKHKEVLMYLYKQDLGIRRSGRFGSRIFKADGFVFRRKTLYSGCGRSDPCSIHYLAWI